MAKDDPAGTAGAKSKTDQPAATTGTANQPTPEPPKPIAVGDVISGWKVDAINSPTEVVMASGAERRIRTLADLEREREAAVAPAIAVGEVIDGWTVVAVNGPTDVQVVQGAERRTLTIHDLDNAKRVAAAQTEADLAQARKQQPASTRAAAAATK